MLTVLVLLAGTAFTFGLVRAVASEIPLLDPAAQHSEVDGVVYASDGRSVLAVLRGQESRVLVKSISDVSPIMRQAIVSVEDRRFYEHNGVDTRGIMRALWEDVRSQGVVEGGSTITQQFVKNAYVRNQKTIARKVREAALAWQLEQRWPKDRILLAYLNTIYFGNGAYGIQQASRTYFGKGAAPPDAPRGCAPRRSAGRPVALRPHPASPRRGAAASLRAPDDVRPGEDHRAAAPDRLERRAAEGPEDVHLPGTRRDAGQYFVNYVTDQLISTYGAGRVFGGGLKVTSTIDLKLQETAHKAIESVLKTPGGPAAALVAIDPRTGAVRAMVGGSNFRESQFNLATQAERQPGSSFKPIVLATALRQGISPVTTFESKTVDIDAGDRIWHVTNYEGEDLGRIDLSKAMVVSDNSVYAQLTKLVGPKAIVKTAHKLGIHSQLDPYFSIGLGAVAVNPLDMTRAYATFANRGVRVDGSITKDRPRVVERVQFARTGRVTENRPVGKAAMTTGEADLLTSILQRRRHRGNGQASGARRPSGGRQDRDDRQLRRRVVRGLHASARRRRLGRVSRQAATDAHRVRRQAGGRRHAPGRDLARLHDGGGQATRNGPGAVPVDAVSSRRRTSGSSGAAGRTSSTTATAPERAWSPTSSGAAPRCRQSATRTRCRCRSSSARRSTRRTRRSRSNRSGAS